MILTDKNRQKHILTHDRYGVTYVKNFFIMPNLKAGTYQFRGSQAITRESSQSILST